MAASDVSAGATVPDRSALRSAQSVRLCFTDKTACQVSPSVEDLLVPHINALTNEQQPFTDCTTAVNMLAYARDYVELKRMLPRTKREDCLRVLKRLLHELSDDEEALADTLRVLNSLQYNKAQLQANQLGPVLQTLSGHGAGAVAAEAQQALQQFQDVPRSVFGRQWYLSEERQALPVRGA